VKHGVSCARIHGNRSQAQRTLALSGFKSGEFKVLVATDIAAHGIDVEALSHVVNFDVPHVSEDYIHRVGRTARAEQTGDAFTFVSSEEEGDLRDIEKALGKKLPRVTAPDFDYTKVAGERPEVPIGERLAAIRAQRAPRPTRQDSGAGSGGGQQRSRPARPAAPRQPSYSPTSGGERSQGSGARPAPQSPAQTFRPVRGR